MRGRLVASFTAFAGVATAAPAPGHEARAPAPWIAVNGTGVIAGHGLVSGAEFDLAVDAGYLDGAPGFHVHCVAYYVYSGDAADDTTACTWYGTQPAYSEVAAATDYNTLAVTVQHQWLAAGGIRKVSSAVGTLPAQPDYQVPLAPFPLEVSDVVTSLPGVIGDFGTWTATNADFVRDSAGRLRGMQYDLSAPSGYALDAPGFEVSCYYDYNPDPTVFPVCTPVVGKLAAAGSGSSQVSLWASVLYNITTVHHEWTAANGTKFQLVGTSDALPDLGQVTTFTISPDLLNTL
ncbi:hypothetical protein F4777DRAFT_578952 [Nemania sp. FL0916]|nr:hypothetical protein F4777DRAFT_578952 [Nemania sp. FL0916]